MKDMRIGILTGGGDCPGLNAVIRAVVRTCDARYGSSVVGFQDGWRGLLENRRMQLRNDDRNDRLLAKGGTMLGTARVHPDKLRAGLDQIKQTLDDNGIDVLIPIGGEGTLTAAHWLSAGLASFARGLNDAPKIVALGAFFYITAEGDAVAPAALVPLFAAVAAGMTAGSVVAGWRVTDTLANRVTRMDHPQGLAANAATTLVLIAATRLGLPSSTTHVITASLVGTALVEDARDVRWGTVGRMAVAWLVTLPVSGALASASYLLIRSWM